MLKMIIYTRFPAVVADLLESYYKRIVIPDAAALIGPIEVGDALLAFPYSGNVTDYSTIDAWIKWGMNCGLIDSYKLTMEQA